MQRRWQDIIYHRCVTSRRMHVCSNCIWRCLRSSFYKMICFPLLRTLIWFIFLISNLNLHRKIRNSDLASHTCVISRVHFYCTCIWIRLFFRFLRSFRDHITYLMQIHHIKYKYTKSTWKCRVTLQMPHPPDDFYYNFIRRSTWSEFRQWFCFSWVLQRDIWLQAQTLEHPSTFSSSSCLRVPSSQIACRGLS